MRSMQAFDGGKQEVERDRVGAGDSYVPRKPCIRALSSSDEFVRGVFHFLRRSQRGFPGRSQRVTLRSPQKKRCPQSVLQRRNPPAHRRLIEIERPRRSTERLF